MDKKFNVKLEPLGKTIEVQKNTPLIDVLNKYNVEFLCGGKGTCLACKVKLLKGNIEVDDNHKEKLSKSKLGSEWRLACLSTVTEDITLEIAQFDSVILADNSSFEFTPREGYGIAVDVGTTTIVAQLINMQTGQVLGVETSLNPQSRYGADIMSRISYGITDKGLKALASILRDKILEMIIDLLKDKKSIIDKIVLVGNTVMHHLFCGYDVNSLSMYPFDTIHGGIRKFSCKELKWDIPIDPEVIFQSSIGSFVGSDILAGIMSVNMHLSNDLIALVDLGTNGEIVVGNIDKILVASTAAGPAFEGTNIEMGMQATSGAISEVKLNNNEIDCHIIANVKAKGICGSGLIDAVGTFLELGEIDSGGQITNDVPKLKVKDDVYITQKDIREFQLAKAAIAAGLQILLNKLGKESKDLKYIYISGGFGNFINLDNVINLGMLDFPKEKIKKRGNSALIGAKMMLFLENDYVKRILNISEHISLESDMQFQDIYVEKMMF